MMPSPCLELSLKKTWTKLVTQKFFQINQIYYKSRFRQLTVPSITRLWRAVQYVMIENPFRTYLPMHHYTAQSVPRSGQCLH